MSLMTTVFPVKNHDQDPIMKTTKVIILSALATAVVCNSFAQGAIDVGNNFGAGVFRAPIFGLEVPDNTVSKVGQASEIGWPPGTTVYTGPSLQGTGFTFGFFASTTGITTDPNSLSLIGTLQFGTGGTAGFVTTTTLNVPGVLAGNPTTWQIRVWDNGGGALGFANALYRGQSPMVNSGPLGGVSPGGPVPNPNTASGWTSFNIYAVPEPRVFALAGLGAALMFFIRRR
jgi:hypothetical protein